MSSSDPASDRDKRIADSNWGVKPDDQPANAAQAGRDGLTIFDYAADDPDAVRHIARAQRQACTTVKTIRIEPSHTDIIDIHGDVLRVSGLSYGDERLIELLKVLGAAFDPIQLRQVPAGDQRSREYECTRAWAWGAERTG